MNNKNQQTQELQQRLFLNMLESNRNLIALIDEDTPWSEVEPRWWLDMMALDRQMAGLQKKYYPPTANEMSAMMESVEVAA